MANNVRIAKINAEIQRSVSNIINNTLNNPELENVIISVTKVDTAADLFVSKIYISVLGDNKLHERVMAILDNAKGFIRRELAHDIDLRTVPDLVFVEDNSQEYSENINRLIKQINKGN